MINYDFISELEGGQALNGYVPDPSQSKSGVTIATGFDIGARSVEELQTMGLDPSLSIKLCFYAGLKQQYAQAALNHTPLRITQAEADQIDIMSKRQHKRRLDQDYHSETGNHLFDIPEQAATVIASVAFQYGSLKNRCPTFWRLVTDMDWAGAVCELRDFKDRYPTRRNKEADYLEQLL